MAGLVLDGKELPITSFERACGSGAKNWRKSAAPSGPARPAPIAQQKLAANWRPREICSPRSAIR